MPTSFRTFLRLTVAALVLATPLGAQAAAKIVITPAGQNPSPNLSAGIRVGDMLYASGQLGLCMAAMPK